MRTIHVKRCCNGCGREIGDVTEAEMDAAVTGMPLPDVRDECGCGDGERLDPFDAAVTAARKMPHNGKRYGLLESIRGITKAIEGNLSDEDKKAVVIGAWMGLQVEYDLAIDRPEEEESEEELDSFQVQDRRLWEAIHYASGAMVEDDPHGIKNAMDLLRLWWENAR
jgi:hypothetical protein